MKGYIRYASGFLCLALLWTLMIVSGCGTGENTLSPQVLQVNPAADAEGVDLNSVISITFTRDMKPETINADTITVTGPAGEVAGTVTYDNTLRTAVFTPAEDLGMLTCYTLKVSKEVQSTKSEHLETDYTSVFTTRDGAWGTAGAIEDDSRGDSVGCDVAIDARGNIVAVWQQNEGAKFSVYANRYTPGTGWGQPENVSNNTENFASSPKVVLDSQGNATVVWVYTDLLTDRCVIKARRYTAGTGWGAVEEISSNLLRSVNSLQLGTDVTGNVIAAWWGDEGFADYVATNRYVHDTGWQGDEIQDFMGRSPSLAVDPAGNTFLVFIREDFTGRFILYWKRYTQDTGWGATEELDNDGVHHSYNPQVACDASGNAFVVWRRGYPCNEKPDTLQARRYKAGTGWSAAVQIPTDNLDVVGQISLAVSPAGNVVAVWEQVSLLTPDCTIRTSFLNSDGSWSQAQQLGASFAANPHVVIDPAGRATAVWSQETTTSGLFGVHTSRYIPGTGWSQPVYMGDGINNCSCPELAINVWGQVAIVWEQATSTVINCWANMFK